MTIEPFELIGKTITDAHIENTFANSKSLILEMSDGSKVRFTSEYCDEEEVELKLEREFL